MSPVEAKTTAQKIEMKGEPVNIHNIRRSRLKEELRNVRKKDENLIIRKSDILKGLSPLNPQGGVHKNCKF